MASTSSLWWRGELSWIVIRVSWGQYASHHYMNKDTHWVNLRVRKSLSGHICITEAVSLMLRHWCCLTDAALTMLHQWGCLSEAELLMLPYGCCLTDASSLMLPLWCCLTDAASQMLHYWCCLTDAALLMLHHSGFLVKSLTEAASLRPIEVILLFIVWWRWSNWPRSWKGR